MNLFVATIVRIALTALGGWLTKEGVDGSVLLDEAFMEKITGVVLILLVACWGLVEKYLLKLRGITRVPIVRRRKKPDSPHRRQKDQRDPADERVQDSLNEQAKKDYP